MAVHWLDSGTGVSLLREEAGQVAAAFESIFGDQLLQVGTWGDSARFRQFARTRRYAVAAPQPGAGVDFVSLPEELAVSTDCIDAVFLPHTLETTADPHALLREVDRVLRPDGCVVIAGFNAWGWWGLRHYLTRRRFPEGGLRMISEARVRDWLTLLDYRVGPSSFHHIAAPVYRSPGPDQGNQPDIKSEIEGADWPSVPNGRWNPLASSYLVVARKEVFTLTPVRPAFRRRTRLVGGLVNPHPGMQRD